MSSTITAGNATNGLALSCDNTGILELKTGTGSGTTGLTIDASQNATFAGATTAFTSNVGIGTSSPNSKLEVSSSSTSIPTTTVTADTAVTGWRVRRTGGTYPREYYMGIRENSTALDFYDNTADALRARIDSSGSLLVGTTTSGGVGFTVGTDAAGRILTSNVSAVPFDVYYFKNNGTTVGKITINTSSTSYTTTSDYRLKEDVQPMTGALARVAALKPVTYKWKATGEASEGFIAHELAEVMPDAVTGEKDAVNEDGSIKPQGIDTSFLVATLTAAIKEQQAMIEELKAKVAALEAK